MYATKPAPAPVAGFDPEPKPKPVIAKLAKTNYELYPQFANLEKAVRDTIRRWGFFPSFLGREWRDTFRESCITACIQFVDLPEDEMNAAVRKVTRALIDKTKVTYTIRDENGKRHRKRRMREEHPRAVRDEDGFLTEEFEEPLEEPCGLDGKRLGDAGVVANGKRLGQDTLSDATHKFWVAAAEYAVIQAIGAEATDWMHNYVAHRWDGTHTPVDWQKFCRLRRKVRGVLKDYVK
jgi:hypothetical protein